MTLFDQILTLIAFPFFFVIQCITVDDVFSNHLISGDNGTVRIVGDLTN